MRDGIEASYNQEQIITEQDQPQNDAPGSIPPKQVPFKPREDAGESPADKTPAQRSPIVVKRPVLRRPGEAPASVPAGGNVPQGIPLPPEAAAKKQTSRIDLPAAGVRSQDEIKTVKVKPVSPPQPGGAPLPPGPKPLSEAQVQAAKSKTSRISLEAALGAVEDDSAPKNMPKTIRLKRPTDLPGGATPPPPAATMPPASAPNLTAHLPTARVATQELGDIKADTDQGSITRRKTIKVKRPGAPSVVSVGASSSDMPDKTPEDGAKDAGEASKTALPPGMKPIGMVETESVNVAFVIGAVASILVAIGLVWVWAAQAYGPNAAVTGYTRAAGPNLPAPLPRTIQ